MKVRWTRASVKRAIRALIQRDDVVIEQKEYVHGVATSNWYKKGEHIHIRCDIHKDGFITSVIHELLHIVLEDEMQRFTYTVEEWMIAGIERELFSHINKSPSQLRWWRKHIEARIKGG